MGATELAISIKKYIKQFGGIDVLFPEHTNMGADHFFFHSKDCIFITAYCHRLKWEKSIWIFPLRLTSRDFTR